MVERHEAWPDEAAKPFRRIEDTMDEELRGMKLGEVYFDELARGGIISKELAAELTERYCSAHIVLSRPKSFSVRWTANKC